jgi:AraC-like DNA-binding protein
MTGSEEPDRAEVPATPMPTPLASALGQLRLVGAIFLRAEYTEGWAYSSLDGPTNAGLLHPGAKRVMLFHVVASGRCWIALEDDGEKHWADAGDVIVIPYGDAHTMGGSADAELVPIMELMRPPPWDELPVIRHGAGGPQTDVVCGWLHSEDPLFDPALRALPPLFIVRPTGPAADWVRASVQLAVDGGSAAAAPDDPLATRLPELLLVEVLRLHLASAPAADEGWVAALHDPVLAPVLGLMHSQPERRWTVADLAAEASVSRSLLDARFRAVLGRSPIRYLTDWRMHVAEELLATTDIGVHGTAHRVGYDSEEAFSRAFKRAHGCSPSAWRAERTA